MREQRLAFSDAISRKPTVVFAFLLYVCLLAAVEAVQSVISISELKV